MKSYGAWCAILMLLWGRGVETRKQDVTVKLKLLRRFENDGTNNVPQGILSLITSFFLLSGYIFRFFFFSVLGWTIYNKVLTVDISLREHCANILRNINIIITTEQTKVRANREWCNGLTGIGTLVFFFTFDRRVSWAYTYTI